MHYVQKNNLFLARIKIYNSTENYKHYNFQGFANTSGKFWKISGNIKFPENLQPYSEYQLFDFLFHFHLC